ncbi:MAG: hypothetical protein U0003_04350 [Vampirovibrionales bacterium]
MWFVLLCGGLMGLLASQVPVDTPAWLMIVGAGWMAGYLDGRKAAQGTASSCKTPNPDNAPLPEEL